MSTNQELLILAQLSDKELYNLRTWKSYDVTKSMYANYQDKIESELENSSNWFNRFEIKDKKNKISQHKPAFFNNKQLKRESSMIVLQKMTN